MRASAARYAERCSTSPSKNRIPSRSRDEISPPLSIWCRIEPGAAADARQSGRCRRLQKRAIVQQLLRARLSRRRRSASFCCCWPRGSAGAGARSARRLPRTADGASAGGARGSDDRGAADAPIVPRNCSSDWRTSRAARSTMTTKVDPSIIGGMVTRIGGTVYDGSVATQLAKSRDRLRAAIAARGS